MLNSDTFIRNLSLIFSFLIQMQRLFTPSRDEVKKTEVRMSRFVCPVWQRHVDAGREVGRLSTRRSATQLQGCPGMLAEAGDLFGPLPVGTDDERLTNTFIISLSGVNDKM